MSRECLNCGQGILRHGVKDVSYEYKGHATVVPKVAGWHCPHCHDVEFDVGEGDRFAEAIKRIAAKIDTKEASELARMRFTSLRLVPLAWPATGLSREDFRCAGKGLVFFAWPVRSETGLGRSRCAGAEALRRRCARPGSRYRALSHRPARNAPARCSRRL